MSTQRSVRIAVIGGGIAGVSIASELAARAEVILLEREDTLAAHTTGRSAAMYLPSYGNEVVRALTVASRFGFEALSTEAGVEVLSRRAMLWIATTEGLPALDDHGQEAHHLRLLTADEALTWCPVLRPSAIAAAALDDTGSVIDVGTVHQTYVRRLTARRGEIRRQVPVTAIVRQRDHWIVRAGEDAVSVDVVVNAAGAWADEIAALAGQARVGVIPLRRTLFTSPTAVELAPGPLVVDAQERFYFRIEPGHVLCSPADETPSPPCDARAEELDVARGLELINDHTTLGLRRVSAAWAGLRTFVADRSPVVGPTNNEPTFAWFAGQGGYGIQMAPALARAGAALALGEHLPADLLDMGLTASDLSPERPGCTSDQA